MDKYARYIASGVVIIIVILINSLLRKSLEKNKDKNNEASNIIRQPKQYLYAGILILSICVVLSIFFALLPSSAIAGYVDEYSRLQLFVVPTLLFFPGIYITVLQLNWKIEIKESEFEFTNSFGRKRAYKFDEIDVKQLSRCTRFYKNKKHIVGISMLQENYDSLEKAIFHYRRTKKNARNNKSLVDDKENDSQE
jgi:hypothetical protein